LHKVIQQKALKPLKNKQEAAQFIKAQSQHIDNIIKNLVKQNPRKQFFKLIEQWILHIAMVPLERIRSTLENIEQFVILHSFTPSEARCSHPP